MNLLIHEVARSTVKAVVLGGAICVLSSVTIASSAEAANDIRGCWERTDSSRKYPTSLTYCFLSKGRLQGWDIDNGHGVDFYGFWKKYKNNRVIIKFEQDQKLTCTYDVVEHGNSLQLEDCTVPSMDGSFSKSNLNIK